MIKKPITLSEKYYDVHNGKRLSAKDVYSLDEWLNSHNQAGFAMHPNGFPVFLTPEEIISSDEYVDGDPYSAEEGVKTWPAFQSRRFQATLKLLENTLIDDSSNFSILDVACGEGIITGKIKEKFPSAEVFGIDYSLSAIEKAVSQFGNIDFSVGDAYRLPYAPESFDVAVLNNIWEHVPDPLRLLESVKRVLKPGGYAIISTPSRYRFRNMVRVCLGMDVVFMSKHHVTEYTVGQVLEQLRFAGMDAKVFDEPLSGPAGGALRFVAFKLVVPIIRMILRVIGSHHSPEETVFFLAKRIEK